MSVTATVMGASEYFADSVDVSMTADDSEAVAGLVVDDVKPGDWGIICFDIEVGDNPGYVMVSTDEFEQRGGAHSEPEESVDSTNEGDLGEYLLTTVWQDYDDQSGSKSGLSNLDPVFNHDSNGIELSGGYQAPDNLDGEVNGEDVHYTNAVEVDSALDGYVIKDGNGDPMPVHDKESENDYRFCLLLEIPFEVGNEIQGDTLSFDLVFETEQVRNNDDPFNGTVSNGNGNQTLN
jgi:hypothetical protein